MDLKRDIYDTILVIVNWLIKMIYYESVKTSIDTIGPAKIIIDVVIRHYELFISIVSDQNSLFTSKS